MPVVLRPPFRALSIPVLLAVVAALLVAAAPSPAAADDGDVTIDRLAGEGRIGTAVAISADTFDSADTVLLARADAYADALAGAPLAAALGAPVLLTDRDRLPADVAAEIERLGADEVRLLGGTAAIGAGVASELEAAGLEVVRYAGATRFDTAALVAEDADGDDQTDVDTVFVVEGDDPDPDRGWPDAVSAAPYAGFLGAPILLVTTDEVPARTQEVLEAINPSDVIIVGGSAAVSEEVVAGLADEDTTTRRLAGATRYETSAAVYDEAVTFGMDPSVRYLATGRNFPDALASGPAAALAGTLLLVDGESLLDSPATAARLSAAGDVTDRVVLLGGMAALSAEVEAAVEATVAPVFEEIDYCLTVLHNNDGESQLLNAGQGLEDFGGIARFKAVMDREQARAVSERADGCEERAVLTVTSGDNFLAGPEFSASLDKGVPFYDSIAMDLIGYDALALGNHDFDFGPGITADFIEGVESDAVFLSANLDFSAEPRLQALVEAGEIAPSTTVELGSRTIGVIGATTPLLHSISSPRNVEVDPDVAAAVAEQVEVLNDEGADIIVLISHLQGLDADLALIPELSGVDIIVAGGGDEVLGMPGNLYVPGDQDAIFDSYPLQVEDADGRELPVVTTAGDYRYVGRLVTRFEEGSSDPIVDNFRSRMVRVADESLPDGVAPDAQMQAEVVEPVADYVAELDETVVGNSEVALNGARPDIRNSETNLGNLVADSQRAAVQRLAGDFGVDPDAPVVAIQNGGGIRNNNVIPPGPITELTTFDIAPFANFVGAFEDVTPAELELLLENGYAAVENAGGQFAHIAGMRVEVDLSRQPQTKDPDFNVVEEGERVRSVVLDDGTVIVEDGEPVAGAPDVTVAVSDFLARGGDAYPFGDIERFTAIGVSYQQALLEYIADDLGGTISDEQYPEGGEGRITFLDD